MLPIHEPEECFFGTVAFFPCVIKQTAMAATPALKGILSRPIQRDWLYELKGPVYGLLICNVPFKWPSKSDPVQAADAERGTFERAHLCASFHTCDSSNRHKYGYDDSLNAQENLYKY